MPYLRIQTNVAIDPPKNEALLRAASQTLSQQLGKPERYVMVAVEDGRPMAFAGETAPLAFLELKSIGLQEGQTPGLAKTLCALIAAELAIPQDRIFIVFASVARTMWGWNGSTF